MKRKPVIALTADHRELPNGEIQSCSHVWEQTFSEAGCDVRYVDPFASDFIESISQYDAFLWWVPSNTHYREYYKRVVFYMEAYSGVYVFPDMCTIWHYRDKIAQYYLFDINKIDCAKTHVFFSKEKTYHFLENTNYPFVFKLPYSAFSNDVVMISSKEEGYKLANLMFDQGIYSVPSSFDPPNLFDRSRRRVKNTLKAAIIDPIPAPRETRLLQKNFFYAQEFLPGNENDTRVTIIGNRAFAFRRFNRENDFRASGSGKVDWDPEGIDLEVVRKAFEINDTIKAQAIAMDFLYKEGRPVLIEVNFSFITWVVRDCPGHWIRDNNKNGEVRWEQGMEEPARAIAEDILTQLDTSTTREAYPELP